MTICVFRRLSLINSSCGRTSRLSSLSHLSKTTVDTDRPIHADSRLFAVEGTIPQNGQGIGVTQHAQVRRIFTQEEVRLYAKLIGDNNPLHCELNDSEIASQTPEFQVLKHVGLVRFQEDGATTQPLVHGMLVASVFSCIFGTLIPGSVYRSQNLKFRAPVFANEPIVGKVEVTSVRSWRAGVVVTCDTKVLKDDTQVCIQGEALVWLPGVEKVSPFGDL